MPDNTPPISLTALSSVSLRSVPIPKGARSMIQPGEVRGQLLTIVTAKKINGRHITIRGLVKGPLEWEVGNNKTEFSQRGQGKAFTGITSGKAPVVSYTLHWGAKSNRQDLTPLLNDLEALVTEYDRNRKSPPVVQVKWGTKSWLAQIDVCRFRILGMFRKTGIPIQAEAQIGFSPYNPIIANKTTPISKKAPETNYVQLVGGQSPEMVALEYFGDPMFGILIRHTNPDRIQFGAGDIIRVLDRDHPKMLPEPGPISPALLDPDFRAHLLTIANARLDKGKDWIEALRNLATSDDSFADALVNSSLVLREALVRVSSTLYRVSQRWRGGNIRVFVNGVRVSVTESVDQRLIVLPSAVTTLDFVEADYETEGDILSNLLMGAPFTGTIDGVNNAFVSTNAYSQIAGSWNGIAVPVVSTSSVGFGFASPPPLGTTIIIDIDKDV